MSSLFHISFFRIIFLFICVLSGALYAIKFNFFIDEALNTFFGATSGMIFGFSIVFIENRLRAISLKAINTVLLGIFIGYLLGYTLSSLFEHFARPSFELISPVLLDTISSGIFLTSLYMCIVLFLRGVDEFYLSIPFVKFQPMLQKKKDSLLDLSILNDHRIVDLALSGLLDNRLIIPRFLVNELHLMSESEDELLKTKAKKSLETLKRLEQMPNLNLKFDDTDFNDTKELQAKLIRCARHLDASILTADIGRLQQALSEGVQIINIHLISNALKPVASAGEVISIKIQKKGKDPLQGVGYLENGAMVVVNGGEPYVGKTIKAQVISIKLTSSGRMIFSNAIENSEEECIDFSDTLNYAERS